MLDKFNNLNAKTEEAIDKCCSCCKNAASKTNNFMNQCPALSTSIAVGSVIATASVISPIVRKVTVPSCKYLAKQQIKLLAGIGVFSIANYIAKNSSSDNILI